MGGGVDMYTAFIHVMYVGVMLKVHVHVGRMASVEVHVLTLYNIGMVLDGI